MTTEIQENAGELQINTGRFVAGADPRRNLSGRPKKTFTDIVAEFPEQRKVQVVEAQFQRAESGDTRAAEFLRDTQDGRPTQRMEVTDTSVADALRLEVLAALANAGAISYVDAEYEVLPEET
jgi:hypothetical protein